MSNFKTKEINNQYEPIRLENMLKENEQVLFSERPDKKTYFSFHFFKGLPLIVINFCFCSFIFFILALAGAVTESLISGIIVILVYTITLTPLWVWLGNLIIVMKNFSDTEYLITNQRVLIKNGNQEKNVKIIDNPEIINVKVYLNKTDEQYKTGQIKLATYTHWFHLYSLANYHNIGKHFERICAINEENAKPYNEQTKY